MRLPLPHRPRTPGALLAAALPALSLPLAAALLALLALPLPLAGAPAALGANVPQPTPAVAPRTTLPTVEGQVMCVTCKIPLSVADSPQASRERVFIQGLIDRGRSEAQIKRALVYQYGPAVLALPASHGFDLTVYVVPVVVLLALLATIAAILPRWRRRARAAQAARAAAEIPSPGALSTADAARLEADMARFD
jgi:cytochrome c-type biogenesis protein CcmH